MCNDVQAYLSGPISGVAVGADSSCCSCGMGLRHHTCYEGIWRQERRSEVSGVMFVLNTACFVNMWNVQTSGS